MYTASFLLDIETTFAQMDRLPKAENREQSMLEDCKDAVILHDRINRYLLIGDSVTNSFLSIFLVFQVHL